MLRSYLMFKLHGHRLQYLRRRGKASHRPFKVLIPFTSTAISVLPCSDHSPEQAIRRSDKRSEQVFVQSCLRRSIPRWYCSLPDSEEEAFWTPGNLTISPTSDYFGDLYDGRVQRRKIRVQHPVPHERTHSIVVERYLSIWV